jgi:hypothetical protein
MDESFVRKHKFPVVRLSKPIPVEAIDGRMLSSGAITEATVPLILQLNVLCYHFTATSGHPWIVLAAGAKSIC